MHSMLYLLNFMTLLGASTFSAWGLMFGGYYGGVWALLVLPFALVTAICLYALHYKKKGWGVVACCISALTTLLLLDRATVERIDFLWFIIPIPCLNTIYFAYLCMGPQQKRRHRTFAAGLRRAVHTWWKRWGRVCLAVASLLVLCAVGTLFWHYTGGFTLRPYSAADINKAPSILTGKRLRNTVLSDLVLENVTIENATFENVSFKNALFTNTTFKNCTFTHCSGEGMAFDRVLFEGGRFLGFANADTVASRSVPLQMPISVFAAGEKFSVVFQGMSFAAVQFTNIIEGVVAINNCTFTRIPENMFTGRDTLLRVDNSKLEKIPLAEITENSKAYITNSTLKRVGFEGKMGALYIDNCTVDDVKGEPFIHVVKNSRVLGAFFPGEGGRVWLANNSYSLDPESGPVTIKGKSTSITHIIGKEKEPVSFEIYSGTVFIENISVQNSDLGWRALTSTMPCIHLKNVDLQSSALNNAAVEGSTWQNVRLYPPIRTTQRFSALADSPDKPARPLPPETAPLRVHELTFPQGEPWEQSSVPPTMIVSPAALPWPDVQVPTAEGLGLEAIPLSWSRE